MKTICVTGVAGFLGSHVAQHLIENKHHVIGIDDLSGGSLENVPKGVSFIRGDVCDPETVAHALSVAQVDIVVHCAAFASENLSHNCRMHTYRSIVMGTGNVVNACVNKGVRCLINMSSIAVYGHQPPPFKETDTPLPADPYGAAKACSETDLKAAYHNFGLHYVIFRPHNIIGTRQSLADSTRNVASIFIRQALAGQPLTIFGDGLQTRAFSPVSYVSKVIAASVDRENSWNHIYNLGGDVVMTVNDLADTLESVLGRKLYREYLPERLEAKHAHSEHSRVQHYFGDIPHEQTIAQCLEGMVEEARKRPLPPIKPLPPIEIQKNLNPAWTR